MSHSELRFCRGCGLSSHPPMGHWALFDVHSPTGICFECADKMIRWDPQEMALIWEIDITPEAFAAGHRPLRRALA
ncbi:MAG TPA: hypothetical protein VNW24_00305 [Stellaceae bacterium]|jgi:hypothetical protein|nr:hypothetical protein [Stellaceae bacterium]